MNPRGPPGTPMDIETFPSNISNKIHGANPFTILNISLVNNAEAKCKFFFFSFLSKHLDFSEKLARVSFVFRTFPNLQNLRKHLKTLLIFQSSTILNFSTSVLGLIVHNPIKHNIYIYTFIYIYSFQSSKHLKLLQIHAFVFIKRLGLSRT